MLYTDVSSANTGTITGDKAGQIINVNKKENWAENSPLWNTGLGALGC